MMTLLKNTLNGYSNPVLIETGTYLGEGIQAAIEASCFDLIISIEISEKLCLKAREKFHLNTEVAVILGDSYAVLWNTIKDINNRITFVLDAHSFEYGGIVGTDQIGLEQWPLVKELEIIARHPRKDHTIIIDDVRLFKIFGTNGGKICKLLKEINPNYHIHYLRGLVDGFVIKRNQVLVAEVCNG